MTKENNIEIYRQRYETFRYFDKLRWQMIQILVAIFSATVLIIRLTGDDLQWWFYLAIGVSLVLLSWVMHNVNAGLKDNSIVLSKAAQAIGDDGIPDVSKKSTSVSYWITIIVGIVGIVMIIWSIWSFILLVISCFCN